MSWHIIGDLQNTWNLKKNLKGEPDKSTIIVRNSTACFSIIDEQGDRK